MRIPILYDEDGLVAVDKPAGLPSTGHTLEDPDCVQFKLCEQLGRHLWAIHQLDRPTSGVLLFVRKKRLVKVWHAHLKAGEKRYLALCRGRPPWGLRRVREPIAHSELAGRLVVMPGGQSADTHLTLLEKGADASWVLARPRTGRTHQIRVHLAHLHHPLVGETVHAEADDAPRAMLHCASIALGGVTARAAIPSDMRQAAEARGLSGTPDASATH